MSKAQESEADLCYGEIKTDWETEEGHTYFRCWFCTVCDLQEFDFYPPTPHKRVDFMKKFKNDSQV